MSLWVVESFIQPSLKPPINSEQNRDGLYEQVIESFSQPICSERQIQNKQTFVISNFFNTFIQQGGLIKIDQKWW